MILTLEQVEAMTSEECQKHLKLLDKTYPMDKSLSLLTPEILDQVDDIANTLLYLEDHIRYLAAASNAVAANKTRWGEK